MTKQYTPMIPIGMEVVDGTKRSRVRPGTGEKIPLMVGEVVQFDEYKMPLCVLLEKTGLRSRNFRDNDRRILKCHGMPAPDADALISGDMAKRATPLRIKTLAEESGLNKGQAWPAVLRMIGAGRIGAKRNAVIANHSLFRRPDQ